LPIAIRAAPAFFATSAHPFAKASVSPIAAVTPGILAIEAILSPARSTAAFSSRTCRKILMMAGLAWSKILNAAPTV
jgi:hypothetical protein